MRCSTCGRLAGSTNHVHYATNASAKPCEGSWAATAPVVTLDVKAYFRERASKG